MALWHLYQLSIYIVKKSNCHFQSHHFPNIFHFSRSPVVSRSNRRSMIPVTASHQIGWMIRRWMIQKLQNQHLGFNIVWCCPLVGHFNPLKTDMSPEHLAGCIVWHGLNCFFLWLGNSYRCGYGHWLGLSWRCDTLMSWKKSMTETPPSDHVK